MIDLVEIIVDFIKKYYLRDINYNIKKYMDVNKFIFSYEYNVAKCKLDFSKYTLIVLTTYIVASLFLLSKVLIPIFEGDNYFGIWIRILSLLLILVMSSISENLYRYYLGDVGDSKNVDMIRKDRLKKNKDILLILAYYHIPYILLFLYMLTGENLFMIISIIMISFLPVTIEIYRRRFQKIESLVKKYYKNIIKIKTIDGILKKYKTSETYIQMLSNNDLVVIETNDNYSSLIRANDLKYIRIENDIYYLKDGKYKFKENFFENKELMKKTLKIKRDRKRFKRRRLKLDAK